MSYRYYYQPQNIYNHSLDGAYLFTKNVPAASAARTTTATTAISPVLYLCFLLLLILISIPVYTVIYYAHALTLNN